VRCRHGTPLQEVVGGPSAAHDYSAVAQRTDSTADEKLRHESYAMQEIDESWVAAQRVKSWINV
jgi:hypothetical protein